MERDFVEMLSALNAAGAEYLVVGAHALGLAAYRGPRAISKSGFAGRPRTPAGSSPRSAPSVRRILT